MHETALVRDVVRRIEDFAQATGARRITGAKIWLGALSHLSAEHFREHYPLRRKDRSPLERYSRSRRQAI